MKTIQEQRTEFIMNKRIYKDGESITRYEWCKILKEQGYTANETTRPRVRFNRTKFNRMDNYAEQKEYDRKCAERIPSFELVGPDGSFFEVEKTIYNYFLTL